MAAGILHVQLLLFSQPAHLQGHNIGMEGAENMQTLVVYQSVLGMIGCALSSWAYRCGRDAPSGSGRDLLFTVLAHAPQAAAGIVAAYTLCRASKRLQQVLFEKGFCQRGAETETGMVQEIRVRAAPADKDRPDVGIEHEEPGNRLPAPHAAGHVQIEQNRIKSIFVRERPFEFGNGPFSVLNAHDVTTVGLKHGGDKGPHRVIIIHM
jgi:hypothetical protein